MMRIPVQIQLARLTDPLAVYFGEFPFEVTTFQAYNLKYLVSTPFSANKRNRGSRHSKELRYEVQRCLVGLALNRWCIQTYNQLAFAITSELILLCIRNDANLQLNRQG